MLLKLICYIYLEALIYIYIFFFFKKWLHFTYGLSLAVLTDVNAILKST